MARLIIATLAIAALAACTTNVQVEGEFPEPVNHSLPVSAGLVLDESFRQYAHEAKQGREISFAIGEAQAELFETVAASLFTSSQVLEAMPEGAADVDLLLAPQVEEIQLATPFATKLNVFEVWIKYNIRVFEADGTPIADWIMTAYGKTPTRFLTSDAEALNQAAVVALRDAGARLLIEFPRIPEVYNWLQARNDSQAVEP